MKKNNLDERQEQDLIKIEKNGCWIAFWGLIVAIAVQGILFQDNPDACVGELTVLFILSLYISVECIRKGVWDRKLKPDLKTNLLCSLIAGVAVMLFQMLFLLKRAQDTMVFCIICAAVSGVVTFLICTVVLQIAAGVYRKRLNSLEEESEDEEV